MRTALSAAPRHLRNDMNIHDALTYAMAVLSGGPEWHEQTAAADALSHLRDALPPLAPLTRAIEDLEIQIDALPDTPDWGETRAEAVADLDALTALARALSTPTTLDYLVTGTDSDALPEAEWRESCVALIYDLAEVLSPDACAPGCVGECQNTGKPCERF